MSQLSERLFPNEEKAIRTFVQQLQSRFVQDIVDIRLFGSKARGQAGPESDLDILILVTRPDYRLKHAILWMAAEISLIYDVLVSPRVIPIDIWHKMAQSETLFYRDIHTDGISLIATQSNTFL